MVPFGLGLLGFIEPCTVGSSLLFVKYLEGKEAAAKLLEVTVFAATRAVFIGALGALAALIGSAFLDVQRWLWVLLGAVYVALGVVFGRNIPACAAPLLAAVLAASLGTATVARGFWTMAVFGLALSLPRVVAVFWSRARGWLDRLAALSNRIPSWTGVVFILGGWSIYFGVSA